MERVRPAPGGPRQSTTVASSGMRPTSSSTESTTGPATRWGRSPRRALRWRRSCGLNRW